MKKTILVADDDLFILDIYKILFADLNVEVHTAESGAAALQVLRERKVDLLVADIRMPDGDGEWLLKNIPYPVKTILVSGLVFSNELGLVSNCTVMSKEDFIIQAAEIIKQLH